MKKRKYKYLFHFLCFIYTILLNFEAFANQKILGKWVLINQVDDFIRAFQIKNTDLISEVMYNKGDVVIDFNENKTFKLTFYNGKDHKKINIRGDYFMLNNVIPNPITFSKISKIKGSRHFIIKINSVKNKLILSHGSLRKRLRPINWSKDAILNFNFVSK